MTNKFLARAADKRWCYLLKTNGCRENRFVGCGITRSVWDFLSSSSFVSHPTGKVKWDVENLRLESSPLNQQQWARGWPESASTVYRCKQPPWTVACGTGKAEQESQETEALFLPSQYSDVGFIPTFLPLTMVPSYIMYTLILGSNSSCNPLIRCVPSVKVFKFSMPQFPHL